MPVTLADRHSQMFKHARALRSQIDSIRLHAAEQIARIQAELDRVTVRLEFLDELLQDDFNNNVEIAEEACLCQPREAASVLGKVCLHTVASTDLSYDGPAQGTSTAAGRAQIVP